MGLWKRFAPQLAVLAVICLIAGFGYIKAEIIDVSSMPDMTKTIILDAGHPELPNTIH